MTPQSRGSLRGPPPIAQRSAATTAARPQRKSPTEPEALAKRRQLPLDHATIHSNAKSSGSLMLTIHRFAPRTVVDRGAINDHEPTDHSTYVQVSMCYSLVAERREPSGSVWHETWHRRSRRACVQPIQISSPLTVRDHQSIGHSANVIAPIFYILVAERPNPSLRPRPR